ncbi:MAG: hypothetical protein ACWGMZ_11835 [Thermoguttaceae bacterium]
MSFHFAVLFVMLVGSLVTAFSNEPPATNPFPQSTTSPQDAVPGFVELSDGSILPGHIYLTRDKNLKIYDKKLQRQREIPLCAVREIHCTIKREWIEKEWKFEESAKNDKMHTGRSYPVRLYEHAITLQDGRKINGQLSAIVYIRAKLAPSRPEEKTRPFILYKRQKGKMGQKLRTLLYVKSIKFGRDAFAEGTKNAAKPH